MEFLNPEQVLNQLELSESMLAADFGCGAGGWAIPLAKKLRTGKVYAIDIQEEALSALRTKIDTARLNNLKLIRADLEQGVGSSIQANLLDLVLETNLLFQANDKKKVVEEAKRVLKQGGELLVVDWKPQAKMGPEGGRISPSEVEELAKSLGFVLDREIEAGSHHYGLLFKKPR
ncbi:MAG: class I SAM-dependent methyltransferase [bacterium]|nr:class I SAM-dependent methyltransferase [bacterium]